MPTTIATTPGEFFTSVPAHTVSLKQSWGGTFQPQPYLYCDTCAKRAAPDKSSAILHYDFGWIIRPGADAPEYFPRLTIDQWYVLVSIDQFDEAGNPLDPITWYGLVFETGDDAFGTPLGGQNGQPNAGDARQPTGTQKFTCYGLEELLYQEAIRASTIENPLFGQVAGQPSEVDVGRPLAFNAGPGRSHDVIAPNRSLQPGVKGAPIFADSLAEGECASWSSADVAEYLLAYRTPRNFLGLVQVPFLVDPASADLLPDWDQPRLAPQHETTGELLQKLLSRKRLVGYSFDVDPALAIGGIAPVVMYPFTFTATPLSVPTQTYDAAGNLIPGVATVEANPDPVALDFDLATNVEYAQLRRTAHDQYDQVRVRGARKTSTFTVSFADVTLDPDWLLALAAEYDTAASTQPDYPDLNAQAQQRNHLWRSSDRYDRVYRWFALPAHWTATADNGENSGVKSPVFPVDDQFATLNSFYRPGLLLTPYLGLWSDKSYVGDESAWIDLTPPGGRPERLRSMAFLKVATPDGTTRYQAVEKLSDVLASDKHTLGGAQFNCSLRMQDKAAGVILHVHGPHQHAIAKSDFIPLTTPLPTTDITPPLDYRDNLICTVCAEHDHHAEGLWPAQLTAQQAPIAQERVRTLLIDLSHLEGHNALRLDYLVPNTVVALQDGQLQRSSGGYVRDDRGRLNATAQMAYAWYAQERQAFEIKFKYLSGAFFVGQLVTSLGAGASLQAVNTPITSVVWDLLNGTTTLTTGYGELDFTTF